MNDRGRGHSAQVELLRTGIVEALTMWTGIYSWSFLDQLKVLSNRQSCGIEMRFANVFWGMVLIARLSNFVPSSSKNAHQEKEPGRQLLVRKSGSGAANGGFTSPVSPLHPKHTPVLLDSEGNSIFRGT